jgi:hypothetical protein
VECFSLFGCLTYIFALVVCRMGMADCRLTTMVSPSCPSCQVPKYEYKLSELARGCKEVAPITPVNGPESNTDTTHTTHRHT